MTEKTTIDILRDAKALLETKGWTQHHYARNAEGAGASLAADAKPMDVPAFKAVEVRVSVAGEPA